MHSVSVKEYSSSDAVREISELAACRGYRIFKIVVESNSILLSLDLTPGNPLHRKAHYIPFLDGKLSSAVFDMLNWVRRVQQGAAR